MSILAQFEITSNFGPYGDGPEKSIEIIVYNKKKQLRKAAAEYSGENMNGVLAICHPYTHYAWSKKHKRLKNRPEPDSAIIRLCEKHCGIGVLTHEIAHAVVHIATAHRETPNEPGDDEDFAWLMGDFVRLAVLELRNHGVWQ